MRIQTSRLEIRSLELSDTDAVIEIELAISETPLAEYNYPWPADREGMEDAVFQLCMRGGHFAICLLGGPVIGTARLEPRPSFWRRRFDLGYGLHPTHCGKGYATEAAEALVRHAFLTEKAFAVHAGSVVANVASCRVLEKLGFSVVGAEPMAFRLDESGRPIVFEGRRYELRRKSWLRN